MDASSQLFYAIQAWIWEGKGADELKKEVVACWEQAAREDLKRSLDTLRKP